MIKYCCDMCGRESLAPFETYQIPDGDYEYIIDRHGNKTIKRSNIGMREIEVCECCAIDICDFIGAYKKCKGSIKDTIEIIEQRRDLYGRK